MNENSPGASRTEAASDPHITDQDTAPALAFLREWFDGCSGFYGLSYKPVGSDTLRHETFEDVAELAERAAELEPYCDVWFRTTTLTHRPAGRGKAADTASLPGVWADLDIAGDGHKNGALPADEAAARSLVATAGLPEPSAWVHTGGGLSAFWRLDSPVTDLATAGELARRVQAAITGAATDAGVKVDNVSDLARIMRLPGTTNRKLTTGRPARVLEASWHRYAVADLLVERPAEAVAEREPRAEYDADDVRYVARPDARREVDEQLRAVRTTEPGTGFNNTLNSAAMVLGHFVGGLFDEDEATAELVEAVEAQFPAANDVDLATIRSGLAAGMRQPHVVLADPGFREWTGVRVLLGVPREALPASSWAPIDLGPVLDGKSERMVPTLGRRHDGQPVLYPGKEHVIAGEPESGKTWFALAMVRDVLIHDGRVVYIDFEDDERTVVGRMQRFNLQRHRYAPGHFRYVRPDSMPTGADLAALLDFEDGHPDLVVLDGWTEGAGLLGLDIMSQDDITRWRRGLIKPCLDAGAATLTTDHVVKDKERRGRFSIGAGHKLAGLTGAMFIAEAGETWGKGKKGRSRILISKDRNGALREAGKPTTEPNISHFGDLVGDAESGDMTSVTLFAPYVGENGIRYSRKQSETARTILAYVKEAKEPPLKTSIKSTVGGNSTDVGNLIDRLKTDGYLATVKDGRREVYVLGDEQFDSEEDE